MTTPIPDSNLFPPRYVNSAYRAASRYYGLDEQAAREVVHRVCRGIADQRKRTDVVDLVAAYLIRHSISGHPDAMVRTIAKELGY